MSLKLSGVTLGNITGGPSSLNLYELADVSIVAPVTGQYLRYNSAISEWQNSLINTEVYNFLDTNLLASNGVTLTKVSGPQTVTIGLGDITPTSVAASGTITGSNLTGSNTGDQTITLTTDVIGSGTGTFVATLATVNASPQTDQFRKITVNGKGLTTATSAVGSGDITTALGYTPVNKAGDTMTGLLILSADPSGSLGAATKQYVDTEIAAVASGVNVHASCETGTTAPLAACTYANGTGGVGATLTANVNGPIGTIGGYSITSTGKRVLVKDQASQIQNGIYDVTQLGVADVPGPGSPWILTRSSDFDGSPSSEVQAGDLTFVQEGTNAGTQWVQTNVGTGVHVSPAYDYVIIGTDNIVFSQFAGAGTYVAGSGINISTNTISNTGVLSNIAGTGIGVSSGTGNVTISNTGVTSAIAGTNIAVSAATGAVTFSLTGVVPTAANIAGGLVNQIPFQSAPSTTTFNAGLTFTPGTNTLSVGTTAAGVVSAATGQTLQISSDVSVTISTNSTSRLSIGSTGAFTIGGGTGTSGQVLTSAGSSATPTWAAIPGSALTSTQVGFGSAGNLLTGSADFTYTASSSTLSFNSTTLDTVIKLAAVSGTARSLTINGANNTGGTGGYVTITAGTSTTQGGVTSLLGGSASGGSGVRYGGLVDIRGGDSPQGYGGNITITGGTASSGSGTSSGTVTISGGPGTSGVLSGAATLQGGSNNFGNGGAANVTGGTAGSSGSGGAVNITGGSTPGSNSGGNVFVNGGISTSGTGGYISFRTGNTSVTERFRITPVGDWQLAGSSGTSGQVLISSGSSAAPVWSSTPAISGTSFTNIPNSALTNSSITIGSTTIALGATSLTLAGLTSVDAGSFNATSTKRVKKAIKNISKTYLDKFADLKPREYDRKDYTAHEFGFIAEEMVLVYPEVVGKDERGRATGIDYGKLSTILTAKVQEQQNVINELQNQVAKIMELLKGSK
jgi:hypothetical protein